MQNKFILKYKYAIFLLFLLNISVFNIVKSQTNKVAPKLTITSAELGVFDNKIKHQEFVAFKGSPTDRRDNSYAAAYYNWLEEEPGQQHFILSNPILNTFYQVFSIQKIFLTESQLREKYNYAKSQMTGTYPNYKDEIVKQIFDKIKNGEFKNIFKKDIFKSGVWTDLPFDENDFKIRIDDNPNLSSYEKELYKRTTFKHQYEIRDYEIKETDSIRLQVQQTKDYLGADHRYGCAMIWVPEWHGYAKDIDNPTTVWKLPKVNKNGPFLEDGTKIYIESQHLEPKKLQRFGVTAGTQFVVIRNTPSDSFLNLQQNAYFDICRIVGNLPKLQVKEKLNSLITNPDGLTTILDGITFPNNTTGHDWSKYFGRPKSSTTLSNLWMQLKVKYSLGKRIYIHIFNQWEERIQIPTQKELEEATNDLKSNLQNQTNLEKLGFVKMAKKLNTILVERREIIGSIGPKSYVWNPEKKDWGTKHPHRQKSAYVPDTTWKIKDGIVFRINNGTQNQFVKNKRMTSISTAIDKTTYALDKDGNIFKWTGEEKFNSDNVWEKIPGPKLKQISVGSEKYICGIDNAGKVWKWNGYEFEEEPLISDAAQIVINNLGEIWLLIKTYPITPLYDVYYYAKNVWTFLNDKFILRNKLGKFLTNIPTENKITLQKGKDQNSLWTAINSKNPKDTGPFNYGTYIILKSSAEKYVASNENNELITTPDINQAHSFMVINQPKPTSKDEISKDREIPVLLKSGKEYLSSQKQVQLIEKEDPKYTEDWFIEEYY